MANAGALSDAKAHQPKSLRRFDAGLLVFVFPPAAEPDVTCGLPAVGGGLPGISGRPPKAGPLPCCGSLARPRFSSAAVFTAPRPAFRPKKKGPLRLPCGRAPLAGALAVPFFLFLPPPRLAFFPALGARSPKHRATPPRGGGGHFGNPQPTPREHLRLCFSPDSSSSRGIW